MKEVSEIKTAVGVCVDTGFVSYFLLGKISFLKSDKFGFRPLAFSFFPDLENIFSLPSCFALSTAPYLSAQLPLEGNRVSWEGGSSPTLLLHIAGREIEIR